MQKFQYVLFVLRRSHICYYIICAFHYTNFTVTSLKPLFDILTYFYKSLGIPEIISTTSTYIVQELVYMPPFPLLHQRRNDFCSL